MVYESLYLITFRDYLMAYVYHFPFPCTCEAPVLLHLLTILLSSLFQDRRGAISAKYLKGFLEAEILSKVPKKNREVHYIGTEALSDTTNDDTDSPVRQLRNLLVHLTT